VSPDSPSYGIASNRMCTISGVKKQPLLGHPCGLVVSVYHSSICKVPGSVSTAVTKNRKITNICQCNNNQSREDGSRADSRNVVYAKYTPDNGQYPTQYSFYHDTETKPMPSVLVSRQSASDKQKHLKRTEKTTFETS
jgi:hypothetical protein